MISQLTINYKSIFKILGTIIFIIGVSMIIPWIYAEAAGETNSTHAFRLCTPVTIALGAILMLSIKQAKPKFRAREGYIIVAMCWIASSIIGAFPYYLSDFAISYVDAFFEATSGFTTTGCTAVAGGILPKSLLLWKAISHWLGGMGILIFVISILPALGINGQFIARAEAPGPVFEKMTVRISDSAKILYVTYLSFTVLEFILLMLSGKMSVFDAAIHTMGSISTGGLVVHPAGIAYYDSVYIEIIISIFCVLSSINFVLYHYLVTKKPSYFFRDIELKVFIIIMVCGILICSFALISINGMDMGSAFRDSFFQVISMATTTGYTRSPYIIWPTVCQIVLLTLMFIGGCAASTSGSIKVVRFIVMMKLIWRGCIKRIHPRSVIAVKLGEHSLSVGLVTGITTFIFTFIGLLLFSCFVLSFQGLDLETTITSALSMLSNTGAGFGEAGSLGNYSMFHPLLKLYLSGLMIVGRLELFTIIILFTRNFWGRDR